MTAYLINDLPPEESFAAWGARRQAIPRWRETIMTDAPEPIVLEEGETLVAVITEDGVTDPPVCKVCHTAIEFDRPRWMHSLAGAGDHPVELTDDMRSNMVEHARRELDLLGEDEAMKRCILDLMLLFSSQGHSGFSAAYTVERFRQLVNFENITPLRPDPGEWLDRSDMSGGQTLWQSTRCADAFSTDGGLSYYRLGEDSRNDAGALVRTFHRTTS